jgi:hypothetical protein
MSTGKRIPPPSHRPPQGPSRHSPNAPRGPRVLQPKAASPLRPKAAAPQLRPTPTAPTAYRPQPTPKVLQRKSGGVTPHANAAQRTHAAGTAHRTPVAPPVYRPQAPPRVLQPKAAASTARPTTTAPPVYRPQPLPKVLQRKSNQPSPAPRNAAARPGATQGRPGTIQPKATPAPPAAYRPQPTPLCLRSNRPAASSVAQRKILIEGTDIDKDLALKTGLESQLQQYGIAKTDPIYAALRTNDAEFEYETKDEVAAEILVRQKLTTGITRIEQHAKYNLEGDTLRLGNQWDAVPGISGEEESDKHIFRPTGKASAAMNQLFASSNNHLECSSATVAVHYHALLEVMGPDGFDDDIGDQVVIMPEFIYINEGKVREKAPSRKLIPKFTVDSTADLVPGDWVYFMNYPEYEKVNKILETTKKKKKLLPGAFEGENAVYLGGGRYKGFGVEECTFDQMVKKLKEEYNELIKCYKTTLTDAQKKDNKFETKKTRENNGDTLDGMVPGIEKAKVRRVMSNEKVRTSAGTRLYERKSEEISAKINIANPTTLMQIWESLNEEFRDAFKDDVVARLLTQLNSASPSVTQQIFRTLRADLRDAVTAKLRANLARRGQGKGAG